MPLAPLPGPKHFRSSGIRTRSRAVLRVELLEDRTLLNAAVLDWRAVGDRPFTTTEVVAGVRSNQPLADLTAARAPALAGLIDAARTQVLFGRGGNYTIQVGLRTGADPRAAAQQLAALPFVSWASPNFIYDRDADPREFTPDDPRYPAQYHHPLMQNDLAWDYGFGNSSVVVAVTDDGVDMNHQDLYENIWINQAEIPASRRVNLTDVDGDGLITFRDLGDPVNQGPGKITDLNGDGRITAADILQPMAGDLGGWADGVDGDGNGYVDDLVGWNTIQNTNNPQPSGGNAHGTHVAGITAARTNNGVGVAGTAGDVLIMPIRFYVGGQWTSTVIARSYAYAADNGARIVTTSYNVDSFANDPIFIAGLQYMYDLGVLHFNSAGNNSQNNPPRQRLDYSLYVCSTNSADRRSSYSNYGFGIDLCTPGELILSTLLNNSYGTNSGTSMASPNAAGVAALIWSLYPDWTREQVAAQLLATCDNIDEQNPAQAGFLGCGRANSFRALTESPAPPSVRRVTGLPAEGGSTGPVSSFSVDFNGLFLPDTVHDLANWEMREAGPDGTFDTDDDVLFPLTLSTLAGTPYMVGTNRLLFGLGGALPAGAYRFRAVSGGLYDPFYQMFDGDGDGVAGGHFDRHFFVVGRSPGGGGGDALVIDLLTSWVPNAVLPSVVGAWAVLPPAMDGGDPLFTAPRAELPAVTAAASPLGAAWDKPFWLDGGEFDLA